MKVWNYKNPDKSLAVELSRECEIDQITSLLLVSKGITDPMQIDEFLSDEINLCDPYAFTDMTKASERITRAVDNAEPIAIYGDYDCDGVTSTALLYSVLSEMNADVIWRVPSRDDGYGITCTAVDELIDQNVKLIITVDNGITAFDAIEYANKNGIDVVVTDHHIPSDSLPNAYAVVDPKREDDNSEFSDYAGVGVAFMVCCAISGMPCDEMLYKYGDFVALGTIADVMPLKYDNRTIVKIGLNLINRAKKPCFEALIKASGIKNECITATNLAFGIAPRINASGRMLHPKKAVELLLCDDREQAEAIAKELCNANIMRQKTEAEILEQALDAIESDSLMQNSPVIIVKGEGWHHGVIGIVAAKLCEMFSRPAIVFSVGKSESVGSCRSYLGVSIYDILRNSNSIEKFGGHESAAGLTVKNELFSDAVKSIELSARALYPNMAFDSLDISFKLNPSALSVSNVYSQRILEPFGAENEQPLYALCDMTIVSINEVSGGKHLRLVVSRVGSDVRIPVMRFFTSKNEFVFSTGDVVDIAVSLDCNIYKDNEELSIVARDIKSSIYDIDKQINKIRAYQDFRFCGDKPDISPITRDDVISVYKTIREKRIIEVDESALLFIFKSNDYCKTRIIIDILEQLSFIDTDCDKKLRIHLIENVKSRALDESELFRAFCEK